MGLFSKEVSFQLWFEELFWCEGPESMLQEAHESKPSGVAYHTGMRTARGGPGAAEESIFMKTLWGMNIQNVSTHLFIAIL